MIRFFSHTHTHFYTKNKNGYCSIPEFLFTSYSAVQVSTASTTSARHRFVVCYFFFSPASSSLRLFCCIRLAVRRMCRVCDCLLLLLLLLRLTRQHFRSLWAAHFPCTLLLLFCSCVFCFLAWPVLAWLLLLLLSLSQTTAFLVWSAERSPSYQHLLLLFICFYQSFLVLLVSPRHCFHTSSFTALLESLPLVDQWP
mgnify:CR=1 FL=1